MEGVTGHMYLDVKCLVTCGIGNLIDPVSYALPLPWRREDGTLATSAEIVTEWHRIKKMTAQAPRGGGTFKRFTTLHLDRESIDALVRNRLYEFDAKMRARFDGYDSWPAAAQLGVLSLCWACGAAFDYPNLSKAAAQADFRWMAAESHIAGNEPRSRAQAALFDHAARVAERGLDYDSFPWDSTPTPTPPDEATTLAPVEFGTISIHHAIEDLLEGRGRDSKPPDDAA